jgi:hypothetical protein
MPRVASRLLATGWAELTVILLAVNVPGILCDEACVDEGDKCDAAAVSMPGRPASFRPIHRAFDI